MKNKVQPAGPAPKTNRKRLILLALVIAAGAAVFLPALKGGFVWDDSQYITNNHVLTTSWDQVFTTYQGYYHPIPVLTYRLEYALFKLDPLPYHLTNLLLHAACCALVFGFFLLLGSADAAAFFGALLFAVHPLHVESVGWIAGRKDLLFCLFFLCMLAAYVKYARSGGRKYFALSLAAFILSALSKPFALTAPLGLFALDWFLGRKYDRRLLLEKVPFFACAGLLAAVSAMPAAFSLTQTSFLLTESAAAPATLAGKFAVAGHALFFYLKKFIYPAGLCALYPTFMLPADIFRKFGLSALFLLGTVYLFIKQRAGKCFLGWVLFILPLAPALPFIQVFPAERYMYVPSVGLAYLAGEAAWYLYSKNPGFRAALAALLLCVLGVLAWNTVRRESVWKDNLTLFGDITARYPDSFGSYIAYGNLAKYYLDRGDYAKAQDNLGHEIKLNPKSYVAYDNLGCIYGKLKDYEKAVEYNGYAVKLSPAYATGYFNRAVHLYFIGRFAPALEDFAKAMELDHRYARAFYGHGLVNTALKKYPEALKDFDQALALNPDLAEVYGGRAAAYYSTGDLAAARAAVSTQLSKGGRPDAGLVSRLEKSESERLKK